MPKNAGIYGLIGIAILGILVYAFPALRILQSDNYFTRLPAVQKMEIALVKPDNTIVKSTLTITARPELNEIHYTNVWPEGEYSASLAPNLTFKASTQTDFTKTRTIKANFGTKIIDLPYEKRLMQYDEETNKLAVKYIKEDRIQTEYTLNCPPNQVDIDLIGLYLQCQLAAGRSQSLNADLILVDFRRTLNMDIEAGTTRDLLRPCPQYKEVVPGRIREISSLKDEAYVFTLKPSGLNSMFYPHKFYFYFEKKSPHKLIAWWGGAPREVSFYVNAERLK